MNNIATAAETIKITSKKQYELSGKVISLPEYDYECVEAYAPQKGEEMLKKDFSEKFGEMCRISVTNEDSFQAARRFENALVLNFANAHHAGGGFRTGANAQEESLCRCSTLYASISSRAAAEMYKYNNTHKSSVESDYMLFSPYVCVFREADCTLSPEPFMTSVITIPAPNRRGAAIFASARTVEETFLRRIRILMCIAAEKGYRSLVLGAWGCGAFGNSPQKVSEYFRRVLIDEGYGRCFGEVVFAVYGSSDGKNIRAFREAFGCS